jgi:CDP-paratose 2-epimerase
MKVLVTGGLGVIGSAVVRHYLDRGAEVTVIDSAEERRNEWIRELLEASVGPKGSLTLIRQRLEFTSPLEGLLDGADAVIHAAAHTGIPHSALDPSDDWSSNVTATRNLLEALRYVEHPPPTVLMSSVKPYQIPPDGPPRHGIDEDAPLVPDEPYAASKAAQTMLGMAYARQYDLPVTVLRFSNLYGPAPCHGPRHGWLTWFCIAAAIGRPLEVQGTGEQVRDMLYSDDIVAALLAALDRIKVTRGNVYNVGGGETNCITVKAAAAWLAKTTGAEITHGPGRKNEDLAFWTNHRRFSRATGWHPKVGVLSGMSQVLAWAQANAVGLRKVYEGV